MLKILNDLFKKYNIALTSNEKVILDFSHAVHFIYKNTDRKLEKDL